jgi:hypothetical protein
MNNLQSFTQDIRTKEELIAFINDYINQYALDKVFKNLDVKGIADAKQIINDAFQQLDILYGLPTTKKNTTSEAR